MPKKKCYKCNKNLQGFEILCKFCNHNYCLFCRMPEDHICSGLDQKILQEKEKLNKVLKCEAYIETHKYVKI